MSKQPLKLLSLFLIAIIFLAAFCFATMPWPGTVPVLMYHFVGSKEDADKWGNFVSVETFEKQMRFLSRFGYRVISLDDYAAILTGQKKPQGREIVITFDDGDWSFEKNAAPVLMKYNLPATQFLISEKIKNGSPESIPLAFIKQLQTASRITFQSHSMTHPVLTEQTEDVIKSELAGSKRDLEEMLGTSVNYFAYPVGAFDRKIMKMVEEAGYKLAFTTGHKKLNGIAEGPLSMPRVKISESSSNPIVFWYHISGLYQMIKGTREKIRRVN